MKKMVSLLLLMLLLAFSCGMGFANADEDLPFIRSIKPEIPEIVTKTEV